MDVLIDRATVCVITFADMFN